MHDPRVDVLLAEVEALRARVAELESRPGSAAEAERASNAGELAETLDVVPVATTPESPTDDPPVRGRRDLLRLAGAAAGAAAAATAAATVGTATPAAAIDGGPFTLGQSNVCASETRLTRTGTATTAILGVATQGQPTMVGSVISARSAESNMAAGYFASVAGANALTALSLGGIGLFASGDIADVRMLPGGAPPPNTSVSHQPGDMIVDGGNDLWYCVGAGAPGSWRKLAGPSTTGALHLLSAPKRVYDSRLSAGKFNSGQERVIDARANSSGVPSGAVAVLANLTATDTNSGGFFAAFANGVVWPNNSSVNWAQLNTTVANLLITRVDSQAKFVLHCESGGQPGANAVVDVIGYFR